MNRDFMQLPHQVDNVDKNRNRNEKDEPMKSSESSKVKMAG